MKLLRCLKEIGLVAGLAVTANAQDFFPLISARSGVMAREMLTLKLRGHTGNVAPEEVAQQLTRNYGCYCFHGPGGKLAGPKPGHNYSGRGLDEVDELCKLVYLKQRCLIIDSANKYYGEHTICEPDRNFPWYIDSDTGEIMCGEKDSKRDFKGKRACKMKNCELERDFVEGVFNLYVLNNYQQNPSLKDMDDETYDATCQRVAGGNGSSQLMKEEELKCCGNGSLRAAYNSLAKECCEDGTVARIGNC